ncbi:hypothetical protein, partial [Palleronia caenipelagi]|uniref:hypothetical protein n=1 Tax=Palleronia caenipelagi TaxID=2489174 RepID=UPI001C8F526A
IRETVCVQLVFRDIDTDDILHLSFPYLCLSCRPKALLSVQVMRKDGGDHTTARPRTADPFPIRPPPLPGMFGEPGSGSLIAKEPREVIRQALQARHLSWYVHRDRLSSLGCVCKLAIPFVSLHDPIANLFHLPRHEMTSAEFRDLRKIAMDHWWSIAGIETA